MTLSSNSSNFEGEGKYVVSERAISIIATERGPATILDASPRLRIRLSRASVADCFRSRWYHYGTELYPVILSCLGHYLTIGGYSLPAHGGGARVVCISRLRNS